MSVSAWRPVLETSWMASAARAGSEAWAREAASARVTMTWMLCETTSCISRAMRARSVSRGQRRLLVALALQPLGPLGQPVELAAQGSHHHSGQQRGEGEPGEEHEGLDVVGRQVPAHGGQHDTGFEDHRGGSDEAPLGLERHRVERDEERDIGQCRGR